MNDETTDAPSSTRTDGVITDGIARPASASSTSSAEPAADARWLVPQHETTTPTALDLTIAAWLHAKFQKSQSHKTHTAYAAILGEYRALLQAEGLDLDACDPRRVRDTLRARPQARPSGSSRASGPRAAAPITVASDPSGAPTDPSDNSDDGGVATRWAAPQWVVEAWLSSDEEPSRGGNDGRPAPTNAEERGEDMADMADMADASLEAVEELLAARGRALALVAQAYAARPAQTRYGSRPVAPSTANLRLAVLSSFYAYALRQDALRGSNPISRVERRRVQAYAAATPLAYEDLRDRLGAIDLMTPAGQRDYALLLVGLHTGRRLSELAGMRREHLVIRRSSVEIVWLRCKGGKVMRDELPRGGSKGIAGDVLVDWVLALYGEDGRPSPLTPSARSGASGSAYGQSDQPQARAQTSQQPTPARSGLPQDIGTGPATRTALSTQRQPPPQQAPQERPIWISLARNGTYGHALTLQAIADVCAQRLGTRKVHALRHTFARGLEDAGAKVSEIQARLGHEDLGTTGRYLAQLHQGENPHLGRLSRLYGLERRSAPERASTTSDPPAPAEDTARF